MVFYSFNTTLYLCLPNYVVALLKACSRPGVWWGTPPKIIVIYFLTTLINCKVLLD